MTAYATTSDFEDIVPDFTVSNPTALEARLNEATNDIDAALGRIGRNSTTGNKLQPATLLTWQQESLKRACCYQAEYRIVKGPDFFINFRPDTTSGPDGVVTGREPYLAPKCRMELTQARLFRLWGGIGMHPYWYPVPNQNIDDLP